MAKASTTVITGGSSGRAPLLATQVVVSDSSGDGLSELSQQLYSETFGAAPSKRALKQEEESDVSSESTLLDEDAADSQDGNSANLAGMVLPGFVLSLWFLLVSWVGCWACMAEGLVHRLSETPAGRAVTLLLVDNDSKQEVSSSVAGRLSGIPPALSILTLLTLTALLVHPDGFTWILLRKLRDATMSLVHSSTTCWAFLLDENGTLIASALALATFACLFFFAFVLHKTLAPRTKTEKQPKSTTTSENKHKKKKKKGHHRSNRSGRIKGGQQQQRSSKDSSVSSKHAPEQSEKRDEVNRTTSLPALAEDKPLSHKQSTASILPSHIDESAVPARVRTASTSTADSSAFSDDQSCETTSGRSTPTSMGTVLLDQGGETTSRCATSNKTKSRTTSNTRKQQRRGTKSGGVDTNKTSPTLYKAPTRADPGPIAPSGVVGSSRWDALKPSPNRSTIGGSADARRRNPSAALQTPDRSFFSRSEQQVLPPASPAAESLLSCEAGASTWSASSPSPPLSLGSPAVVVSGNGQVRTTASSQALFSAPPDRKNGSIAGSTSSSLVLPPKPTQSGTTNSLFAPPSSLNGTPSWKPSKPVVRPPPGLTLADATPTNYGMQFQRTSLTSRPGTDAVGESPFLSSTSQGLAPPPSFATRGDLSFDPVRIPMRSNSTVKENPFASDESEDDEDQIEAELQELGGQMVGSILDF